MHPRMITFHFGHSEKQCGGLLVEPLSNLSLSFTALPIEMFFLTNAEFIDVGGRTGGAPFLPGVPPNLICPGCQDTNPLVVVHNTAPPMYQLAHTLITQIRRPGSVEATNYDLLHLNTWFSKNSPQNLCKEKRISKCRRWNIHFVFKSRLCLIFNFTLRLGGPNISPDRQGRELA